MNTCAWSNKITFSERDPLQNIHSFSHPGTQKQLPITDNRQFHHDVIPLHCYALLLLNRDKVLPFDSTTAIQ